MENHVDEKQEFRRNTFTSCHVQGPFHLFYNHACHSYQALGNKTCYPMMTLANLHVFTRVHKYVDRNVKVVISCCPASSFLEFLISSQL